LHIATPALPTVIQRSKVKTNTRKKTHLLYDHFYTRIQIFIQISPPLTKLCHTKRDHSPREILHFTRTLTSMFVYSANDVIGDVMPYRTCLLTL